MGIKKYPDNIVYNYELDKFDSSKKSYPTNLGAPSFEPLVIDKSDSKKANHYFNSQINELRDKYIQLQEEYKWTSLVYSSTYNFQPIVGEVYHLYDNKHKNFLSLTGLSLS